MKVIFSPTEKRILDRQTGRVANKVVTTKGHESCSPRYVNMIINGEREINSQKSMDILNVIYEFLQFLK